MNDVEVKAVDPLIPGDQINLAGVLYTVPAITLGDARAHEDLMIEIEEEIEKSAKNRGAGLQILKKMLPIIGTAIRRNYPDLTDEKLTSIVDMRNLRALYRAALGVED